MQKLDRGEPRPHLTQTMGNLISYQSNFVNRFGSKQSICVIKSNAWTGSGERYLSSATPFCPHALLAPFPFQTFWPQFLFNPLLAISFWHCLSDSCKVICYVNWAMPLGSREKGVIFGWRWRLQTLELENMICIH